MILILDPWFLMSVPASEVNRLGRWPRPMAIIHSAGPGLLLLYILSLSQVPTTRRSGVVGVGRCGKPVSMGAATQIQTQIQKSKTLDLMLANTGMAVRTMRPRRIQYKSARSSKGVATRTRMRTRDKDKDEDKDKDKAHEEGTYQCVLVLT